MTYQFAGNGSLSLEDAEALQREMASTVSTASAVSKWPRFVAGVDVSPPAAAGKVQAAGALLSLPDLEVVQVRRAGSRPTVPYIPGFLAFGVGPLMLEAVALLDRAPDFFIVMGHGLAHPRRFGLACHLGVFADSPTIGCAGTPLTGTSVAPAREAGAWSPVEEDGEVIGAVLRTRDGTRPVHVSVGHKLDLESAVKLTLACCARYRMPEPLREARRAARAGHSGA